MTTATIPGTPFTQAPTLRLLPVPGSPVRRADCAPGPAARLPCGPTVHDKPVLLATDDADECAALRDDLAGTMAPGTTFEHVAAIWEVLARAADTRMVVLCGELEGIPAHSLMHMIAQRNPALPVVCLDDRLQREARRN